MRMPSIGADAQTVQSNAWFPKRKRGSVDPVPPRRVLMTTDTIGGVWNYSLELAHGLLQRGIQVALATMGAPLTSEQRHQAAVLAPLTIYEGRFRLEWMEEPWTEVQQAGDWLLHVQDEVDPDVVHLNNFVHGSLPWRSPVVMVGHSCVLSWWSSVKGHEAPPTWLRYQQAVQTGLRSADIIVAPSQWMLSGLEQRYGPFSLCTVIYNGRRESEFPPGEKEPFLFTAGRLWDEGKNVSALMRVASSLPWPCYVAGASTMGDENSSSSDHSPKEVGPLHLLGHVPEPELAEWLSRAAIYVLPAKYEPFGLSAVEAGLAGCALILGDIPSLRELWQGAAFFVPPDDDTALHMAVDLLIHHEKIRQRLALRARQRAQIFSASQMVSRYIALYTTLLQRQHAHQNEAACVL